MNYQQCDGAGQRGYTPFGIEKAINADSSDQKEFWHHGRSNWDNKHKIIMPKNEKVDSIKGFNDSLNKLFLAINSLGMNVLKIIALLLNQDSNFFDPWTNKGNSLLRLIHYPPVTNDTNNLRARAHEDINLITLLVGAEESGLEVKSKKGDWIPIKASSNAIVAEKEFPFVNIYSCPLKIFSLGE